MKLRTVLLPTVLLVLAGSSTYASSGHSPSGDVSFECINAGSAIYAEINSVSSTQKLSVELCSVGPYGECSYEQGEGSVPDTVYSNAQYTDEGTCTFYYEGTSTTLHPS